MNRVPDQDMLLLDAYLDDELSTDEVDALRERLIEEPELATALADLRETRAARQRVFASMQPGELAVSDVVASIQRAARGRLRWGGRVRESMRYVAAAACVTLGVMIGTKATRPASAPTVNGEQVAVAGGERFARPTPNPFDYPGPARPVEFTQSLRPILPSATPRAVVLTDLRGNVVAAQEFKTAAEAREFVEDLRRAAEATGRTIIPIAPPANLQSPPSAPTFVESPAPPQGGASQVIPVSAEEF